MNDIASLLPPNSTALEKDIEQVAVGFDGIHAPVSDLWDPQTIAIEFLPWLAWGLSIDFWDPDWTDQQKRDATAATIALQMRKGTPASLRAVIDRFDPLINIVEWFEANPELEPHEFMLELPLAADSDVIYDRTLIESLVRDINQVKPVRSHLQAVQALASGAATWLTGGAMLAGFVRARGIADQETALEPEWQTYWQTEDGEPMQTEGGDFLVA